MATIQLPTDFKEFLQLLNAERVDYLLVGGYAVSYHGYPRTTGDLDVWVAIDEENAARLARVLERFGFSTDSVTREVLLSEGRILRMGVPPLRIEVNLIDLDNLKRNKRAAGRPKDLADLDNLP